METQTPIPQSRPLIFPPQRAEEENMEIGIIKGLSFNDRIDEIAFELSGWERDPIDKETWVDTKNPIMNKKGIKNFTHTLRSVSEKIYTMGHLKENQTPRLILWFVQQHFSHFLVFAKDFDLDECNYNLVWSYLLMTSFGGTTKALGAGDRNVVRGVYSEDALAKIYQGSNQNIPSMDGQKKGFIRRMLRI
jgi:hypothetical protein